MVVAGAQMHVTLESAVFAAHKQQQLGVGLVAEDAITTWAPTSSRRAAQPMLASSSKRAINSTATVTSFALLGGADEMFHQDGVGAGAIDRHLHGDHVPDRRRPP